MRIAILAMMLGVATPAIAQTCAPVQKPAVDITSNRFYSDPANSIVDPKRLAQRQAAMQPLEDFRADMTRYASRVLAGQKPWATCLESGLTQWAEAGAMLGRLNEVQAHFERVWMLSGLAMAYLVAREDISAMRRPLIESWLDRVATETAKDLPARRRSGNNHLYWLGFALGASASATGNERLWAVARDIFRESVRHIEADGTLPKEMARAGMASHYHAFSVIPLVMLAELAARRGEDWHPTANGALHRLAKLVVTTGLEPQALAKRAGAQQKPVPRNNFGWLAFYARRFPDRIEAGKLLSGDDIWLSFSGGNMSLLARRWIP
jgi:poly(beta-D-mannuronate) lyase